MGVDDFDYSYNLSLIIQRGNIRYHTDRASKCNATLNPYGSGDG